MDPFQPQQPDEGYSEAPLHASGSLTSSAAGRADGITVPPLLARHVSQLSMTARMHLAESILESLPTQAVAQIVQKLSPRLYIDFIRYLPAEICLNILGYLDPLSLLSAARSCRAWYDLALDRKLWERLYYLEGWRIVATELQAWEEKINRDRPVPFDGGSHLSKRRAISSSRRAEGTAAHAHAHGHHGMVRADAVRRPWEDGASTADAQAFSSSSTSLFGSGARPALSGAPSAEAEAEADMSLKKKGKQRAVSPPPSSSLPLIVAPESPALSHSAAAVAAAAAASSDRLPPSTLWVWDAASDKIRMNWKHLYTLRRRLEANWELGRYTNFQFPHPNYPNEGHGEYIYTIQFDSRHLVSGSRDRTIRIWNLHTRRLARPPLVGHRGSVLCLQFDSDPSEDLIVSGSSDSTVIFWRFSTGQILQRLTRAHREPVLNVKFDKNILVTCSKDRTIKIFTRKELRPGDLGYGDSGGGGGGGGGGVVQPVPIHLKNYGRDGLDGVGQALVKPPYTLLGTLEGHGAAVNAVQIHGREIVSASGDRNVKIWDWPTLTCVRTLIGHGKGIACVQYDGRRVVSGSSDNEIKVFDRHSGLEVASLRSHNHLVRTVQAGFGDLPYSAEEDAQEAARVDRRFLEAVENGTITPNAPPHDRRHGRHSEPADDGGSMLRPEDIRFTGAKLPPGGGGGPYGRIVSASYDSTIIVWRRDKRGVWKPQHHLKLDEASAAAAAATTTTTTTMTTALAASPSQPQASAPSSSSAQPAPPPTAMQVDSPEHDGGAAAVAADPALSALLDELISQGVHAVQQALATHPALLYMPGALQAAVDKVPSPFVRSQLRQAISVALVRSKSYLGGPSSAAAAASGSASASASALNNTAAPESAAAAPRNGTTINSILASLPSGVPAEAEAAAASTTGFSLSSVAGASSSYSAAAAPREVVAELAGLASLANLANQPAPAAAPADPAFPPPPAALMAAAEAANNAADAALAAAAPAAGPPPHHPHIHEEVASPARVFKLQFDARRIICCSQTPVIVGWDFCNGDPELEEAARFFGTIE